MSASDTRPHSTILSRPDMPRVRGNTQGVAGEKTARVVLSVVVFSVTQSAVNKEALFLVRKRRLYVLLSLILEALVRMTISVLHNKTALVQRKVRNAVHGKTRVPWTTETRVNVLYFGTLI